MTRYKIANFEVDSSDPAFPVALAQAYHSPNIEEVRPRCLCRRSEARPMAPMTENERRDYWDI